MVKEMKAGRSNLKVIDCGILGDNMSSNCIYVIYFMAYFILHE